MVYFRRAGTASGAFEFAVNRNAAARGFAIVDGNDLVRLIANDVGIGAGLVVGASTTGTVNIDPGFFSELKGLTLSLGSKDSDSFLLGRYVRSLVAEFEERVEEECVRVGLVRVEGDQLEREFARHLESVRPASGAVPRGGSSSVLKPTA